MAEETTQTLPDVAPEALAAIVADEPVAEKPAPGADILTSNVLRLEVAQSLPEVLADADINADIAFADGSIQAFMSEDHRPMRIVGFSGGLAAQALQE